MIILLCSYLIINLLEKLGILEKLKEMKLLLISLNSSLIKDSN
nr:MAG TPA: hypothetical protein [Caudoviricetes sp.]